MQNSEVRQWFIYMLRCRFGKLYTGISTDVERRISEHEAGGVKGAKYLRGKAPLTLVFYSAVSNRSSASQMEAKVKKLSRAGKEELISGKIHLKDLLE